MDWSKLSTCFASTGPRSNDSFLYFNFLVFPTISGNLLLARSKPRELNYIGFLHSKNTVEGRSHGSRRIDHAKCRAVCDRRRAPWASAMMLSRAFIRSTAFRRNSLLYRCRFFRPTLRLLSRKVCNCTAQQNCDRREHDPLANLRRVDASQAGFSISRYAKRRCSDAWKEGIPGAKQTLNGELQLSFFLSGECCPRTVPDVENVHNAVAFIHRVDNSVGAWLLPKKQMPKFLAFRNDGAALRKSL
jgi:hypothetical protein